jgi:glutaredoxin
MHTISKPRQISTSKLATFAQSRTIIAPRLTPIAAFLAFIAIQLFMPAAYAQVFKWKTADGKTNYSNLPPPVTIRSETKRFGGNTSNTSDLPYDVAQSSKLYPVILYTGPNCAPCDEGRKLLTTRGVPFNEKTVNSNADMAMLGKGTIELPQLTVGTTKQSGFEEGIWNRLLANAGYPIKNKLPKDYRNPLPQAAAPVAPIAEKDPANADTTEVRSPRPRRSRPAAPPAQSETPSVPGLRF